MLTRVENESELRTAYDLLRMFQETPELSVHKDPEVIQYRIKTIKQAIRNYYKVQEIKATDLCHVLSFGYDSTDYTELVALPTWVCGEWVAREYIEREVSIELPPDAFGCTGEPFTAWYKPFKRGDRWYAYLHTCYDM